MVSCTFFIVGILSIILPLAPTNLSPSTGKIPDFLFCVIFSFLVNKPKSTPLFLIVFLSLLADFLWYRPLGLATLSILITTEFLRHYIKTKKQISFLQELLLISAILLLISIFQEVFKLFVFTPSLEIIVILKHLLFTLLIYPIFSLILRAANKLNFE